MIVVNGSSLEIYVASESPTATACSTAAMHEPATGSDRGLASLYCLLRFDLCGIVESMAMVRFPGKDRDQLLLVFKEAKVSVVEYDPSEHDLRTVALNFFESESLRRGRVALGQLPMRVGSDARTQEAAEHRRLARPATARSAARRRRGWPPLQAGGPGRRR